MSEEEFFQRRTEHVRQGGSLWSYVSEYISRDEFLEWQREVRRQMYSQWERLSPPVPGMDKLARELAAQYRLGIIASQPPEVAQVLEDRGILQLFDVHGISGTVGFDKPDPRLYQWALDSEGVKPHEAMMIGDRIDNDIVPAKALGMQTMWLKLNGQARGWQAESLFERCYAKSLNKISWADRPPKSEAETPDLIAESPDEILMLLDKRRH
jgi:HAD superfamily hydrolase (TIGR01549 family)